MPIGIIINCASVLAGGLIGTFFGKLLPRRIRDDLPVMFGICAICISMRSILQTDNMTVVVLAVLGGYLLGHALSLEKRIQSAAKRLLSGAKRSADGFNMPLFISCVTLFCCSGMGWYGALTEAISGSSEILFSKSVLDLFTALIFAASLRAAVCLIPIPQFAVMLLVFLLGKVVSGVMTAEAFANLSGCGGVITLAAGLRIAKIREVQAIDIVPSMIIVIPLSMLAAAIGL